MHKKIISVIDTIFVSIVVYFICFVWIRYYTKNLTVAILLSIIAALVIIMLYKLIFTRRKEEKSYKKNECEEIENYMLSLNLMSKEAQLNFLSSLTSIPNINEVTVYFSTENITKQNIIDSIRGRDEATIIISKELSAELKRFVSCIKCAKVNVIDSYKLYELMKEKNLFPEKVDIKPEKIHFTDIIRYAFSKKRAKSYIFAGGLLLVTSFLIPYKLYYLISGSILLLIALICIGIGN